VPAARSVRPHVAARPFDREAGARGDAAALYGHDGRLEPQRASPSMSVRRWAMNCTIWRNTSMSGPFVQKLGHHGEAACLEPARAPQAKGKCARCSLPSRRDQEAGLVTAWGPWGTCSSTGPPSQCWRENIPARAGKGDPMPRMRPLPPDSTPELKSHSISFWGRWASRPQRPDDAMESEVGAGLRPTECGRHGACRWLSSLRVVRYLPG
jgi:hypothetical protein